MPAIIHPCGRKFQPEPGTREARHNAVVGPHMHPCARKGGKAGHAHKPFATHERTLAHGAQTRRNSVGKRKENMLHMAKISYFVVNLPP